MSEKTNPIVVTIRKGQNFDQALKEKQMERDIELIERIEKEEGSSGCLYHKEVSLSR
mgnify:CR=1 FL=1